ncbi:hypothetical protein H1R20_g14577, partial [Candolleomyces eurysporus]
MSHSHLSLCSLSLTLTTANGDLLLTMDFDPSARGVEMNPQLPDICATMTAPTLVPPSGNDLPTTADTASQGLQLMYEAHYASRPELKDGNEAYPPSLVQEISGLRDDAPAGTHRPRSGLRDSPGFLRQLNFKAGHVLVVDGV